MAKHDPQASFVAESLNNIDFDILYLDYTWNWKNYEDVRPFANVFSAPRLSANIDSSSKDVKLCFVDNVYMNIMPTIPGAPNGSDSIVNNRPLSKALKQCSKLRKQFMKYFVSGKSIGDCILTTAPDKDFHVCAYTLPDRAVMFVLNTSDSKSRMSIDCDLTNWLKSATGKYEVKIYNIDGKQIGKEGINGHKWNSKTSKLKGLDIEVYEFTAK